MRSGEGIGVDEVMVACSQSSSSAAPASAMWAIVAELRTVGTIMLVTLATVPVASHARTTALSKRVCCEVLPIARPRH